MQSVGNGGSRALASCTRLSRLPNVPATAFSIVPSAHAAAIIPAISGAVTSRQRCTRAPSFQRSLLSTTRIMFSEIYSGPPTIEPLNEETETQQTRLDSEPWHEPWGSFRRMLWESDYDALGKQREEEPQRLALGSGAQDYHLWAELIQFRNRVNGPYGGLTVFQRLLKLTGSVPQSGLGADRTWALVLEEPLRSGPYARRVMHLARKLWDTRGKKWSRLYPRIMSAILTSDPTMAREWHDKLCAFGKPSPEDLASVARRACAKSRAAFIAFAQVYRSLPELDSETKALVEEQIQEENPRLVPKWKQQVTSLGTEKAPAIRILPLKPKKMKSVLRALPPISNTKQSADVAPMEHPVSPGQQEIIDMIDVVRGFKPKGLSDNIAAKAFATKAFSLNAIAGALAAMGLEVLGPRAMRELALRCETEQDFVDHIRELRGKRVSLDPSTYCDFLHWAAATKQTSLFRSILDCDLHPDTFEEEKTQMDLLRYYRHQRDTAQLKRTLILLSRYFENNASVGWNALLRMTIEDRATDELKAIIGYMSARRMPFDRHIIGSLQYLLPKELGPSPFRLYHSRKRASKLKKYNVDDLQHLTNIYTKITSASGFVSPRIWSVIMKSYGKQMRLREMESVAMWLGFRLQTMKIRQIHMISHIIHEQLQEAIITWGFKTIGYRFPPEMSNLGFTVRKGEQIQGWDRGLLLLRMLQDLGLDVNLRSVRNACRLRLTQLYGKKASARLENMVSRHANTMKLRQMIDRINEIWDNRAFPQFDSLSDDEMFEFIRTPRLPNLRKGRRPEERTKTNV